MSDSQKIGILPTDTNPYDAQKNGTYDYGSIGTMVMSAIADGITWIRDQLFDFRTNLITNIVNAINTPIIGVFMLIGIAVTGVVLGLLTSIVSSTGFGQLVESVLSSIGGFVSLMAKLLAVDVLITLSNTAAIVNEAWATQLANVYTALSSLSQELETDFSFVQSIAEIARIELKGMSALVPNSFFTTDTAYANSLITWLGTVKGKLKEYYDNPQQIFIDIQAAVIEDRIKDASTATDNALAAIDKSVTWIDTTGEGLLTDVNDIMVTVGEIDPKFQALIDQYWTPLYKQINDFLDKYWKPFYDQYEIVINDIKDGLTKQGISLAKIENSISSVTDFFFALSGGDYNNYTQMANDINSVTKTPKSNLLDKLNKKLNTSVDYKNPFAPYDISIPEYKSTVTSPVPNFVDTTPPYMSKSNTLLFSDDGGNDVDPSITQGE